MQRQRRTMAPNALVHVISRVVDGRFTFDEPARRYYLAQLGRSLARADWQLLSYAIMSNHVHLALMSGQSSLRHWIHPLHITVAHWITRQLRVTNPRARGQVFADRPMTKLMELNRAGVLIAYLHNNPTRAGLVTNPTHSSWTSHRLYARRGRTPSWLRVDLGLSLSGFDVDLQSRRAFHRFVCNRTKLALELEGEALADVEPGPQLPGTGASVQLAQAGARAAFAPHQIAAAACEHLDIPCGRLRSYGRDRRATHARRLALLVSDRLQLQRTGLCEVFAISSAAASQLVRSAMDGQYDDEVGRIVASLET